MTTTKKRLSAKRLIPIALLLIGFLLFFLSDAHQYFSFTSLQEHHQALTQWTSTHLFTAALSFILIYLIAVAFSFPGATLLTLSGGFLFGIFWGTLFVIVGATLGACIIFLAARYAFGNALASKAGGWVQKMEKGFKKNAFSYLLFLRLLPIFPFWLINIVPGLLNVRLSTFFITTFIGIIPGTVVYAAVGSGLNSIFEQGKTPNFGIILEPQILIPLIALAVLSFIPMVYKRIKRGRTNG
jgi:uncharacterized membrane protein YdjX (TVP38/TMEM64 family)